MNKQIAKIYKKRDKAYQTLLECDLEIDLLLKKLDNKQTNNMLILNPLTFKEEEVEVGELYGHEVITFQDGKMYDLKTLLEANKHLIKQL